MLATLGAFANIIAELAKLANLILGHYNDPKMVEEKVNQLHQDLKDRNEKLASTLQDTTKTPEEKRAALDAIRLADS